MIYVVGRRMFLLEVHTLLSLCSVVFRCFPGIEPCVFVSLFLTTY